MANFWICQFSNAGLYPVIDNPSNDLKVFSCIPIRHCTLIIMKQHIQTPMQVILYRPMTAYPRSETLLIRKTRNKIPLFRPLLPLAPYNTLTHPECTQLFPRFSLCKLFDICIKRIYPPFPFPPPMSDSKCRTTPCCRRTKELSYLFIHNRMIPFQCNDILIILCYLSNNILLSHLRLSPCP